MNIFYGSLRIGLGGKTFVMWKFRTMQPAMDGGSPTASFNDPRLTFIGKWLRRFKLDELPTILNILNGDITLVGPRPDVPSEIETLDELTRNIILSVKPGLISPATLWDIDEDKRLASEKNPHEVYLREIKPVKYNLNRWYVLKKSLWFDTRVILTTFLRFFGIKRDVLKIFPSWLKAYEAVRKSKIGEDSM